MKKTTELGFGIMRLPLEDGEVNLKKAEEIIDEYMKGEFCYFDLHPAYMLGKAQNILHELVVERYPRDSYLIANKMPYYDIKCWRDYETLFSRELCACGVDFFDFYMLHALTKDVYEMHEKIGGFKFLEKMKLEGKVKKIGFSFHDKPDLLREILKKHPEVDFVQLQINFLDWNSTAICSEECYKIAREFEKKIIVMEPIKGGSLANELSVNGKVISSGELAKLSLQFVAALSGIDVILSGMAEKEHVKDNRVTLSKEISEINSDIYEELRTYINEKNEISCTACGYCVRECPKNIAIPDIISLINSKNNIGVHDVTYIGRYLILYKGYVYKKGKAGDCIACRKCEQRCPQKLEISKYMKRAADMFERGENYYTSERNAQILIYLLKAHGIKKIIISPGTANICFAYSIQQDDYFEVYSAADERSAAYIACGMAEESGEKVALSCTGATASRNYIPGLTEAFYRKLPILAITSSQPEGRIGHNIPQVIDRRNPPNDIVKLGVALPLVKDEEDEWLCNIAANKALLELGHHGGGPVHINLITSCSTDFSIRNLPSTRVIKRIQEKETFPILPDGKIGIFCGAHSKWSKELTEYVDLFCEQCNAVVICDHTSNYHGRYGIMASLILSQEAGSELNDFDLLIHIGNISGAYIPIKTLQTWRVNLDGEICDTFRSLRYVFEMEECVFFQKVLVDKSINIKSIYDMESWREEYNRTLKKIRDIPFSNVWIASNTAGKLPDNSVLHLGILNSLRCWNFFEIPESVSVYANTGGFGIDGCVSALLGSSLANPEKLHYGVVGDLAFFYDMNAIGNRHVSSNLRLMVINNGCGTEFKNYNNLAARFGENADHYISAKGHYGKKSVFLLKNYAENLGFKYLHAGNKKEYFSILSQFVSAEKTDRPILVEIFTDSLDESEALKIIYTLNGEKRKTLDTAQKTFLEPLRLKGIKKRVVLWGTGYSFAKNLPKVETCCKVQYVCDNDSAKWEKEIVSGIKCISPEKLSEMKDIFVVIMLENVKSAFSVANQLLDMGINDFDVVYNWLEYAKDGDFSLD